MADLARVLSRSKVLTKTARQSLVKHIAATRQLSPKAAQSGLSQVSALTNAMLATDFSRDLTTWLTNTFNQSASVYDKAVDAVFNASHVGGGQLHRLFDGSHTPWEMWDKVRQALPDDNLVQEVAGYASAFGKDLMTQVGIPIRGMSQDSYHQTSSFLSDHFGIPKPWFQDMLHYNGVEVLGAAVATVAVALRWNKAKTEEFSRLVGSLGLAAVASANPALAVVSVAVLSKAFVTARREDDYSKIVDGLAKGGIGTGVLLGTSALVGGPAWVGILTGLCVAGVASRGTSNIHASDVRLFLERTVRANLPATQVLQDPSGIK